MTLPANRNNRPFYLILPVIAAIVAISALLPGLASAAKQKTFSSPEEAVKAMMQVLQVADMKGVPAIFGPGSRRLISSGDRVADEMNRTRLTGLYQEQNRIERVSNDKAELHVGRNDWSFPIPIIREGGDKWRFDTKLGQQEILARRIGRNELAAVQVCLAFVDAEREYAAEDRNGDGVKEYAQKIMSTAGKKDGLYWETRDGEPPSPMGSLVAAARHEGYHPKKMKKKMVPYHGYLYKLLLAQGKDAPGGAYEYVVNGRMTAGFAMVAYPAKYGASGVMTFIVSHSGDVYEKNMGAGTAEAVLAIKEFNPDGTWKKAGR